MAVCILCLFECVWKLVSCKYLLRFTFWHKESYWQPESHLLFMSASSATKVDFDSANLRLHEHIRRSAADTSCSEACTHRRLQHRRNFITTSFGWNTGTCQATGTRTHTHTHKHTHTHTHTSTHTHTHTHTHTNTHTHTHTHAHTQSSGTAKPSSAAEWPLHTSWACWWSSEGESFLKAPPHPGHALTVQGHRRIGLHKKLHHFKNTTIHWSFKTLYPLSTRTSCQGQKAPQWTKGKVSPTGGQETLHLWYCWQWIMNWASNFFYFFHFRARRSTIRSSPAPLMNLLANFVDIVPPPILSELWLIG